MNDLVFLKKDEAYTDSLVIANGTGIGHRKIKNAIKKYQSSMEMFGKLSAPCEAESTGGRREQYYVLNEEQATFLMTLLKNTKPVVDFKVRLVRRFYEMRCFIAERHTQAWIETRAQGKLTRREETDAIKEFVEYARGQGSGHPDKYYGHYSNLANKAAGIGKRDTATISQLNNLALMEHVIGCVVREGILADKPYKDIYADTKKRIESLKVMAYLA